MGKGMLCKYVPFRLHITRLQMDIRHFEFGSFIKLNEASTLMSSMHHRVCFITLLWPSANPMFVFLTFLSHICISCFDFDSIIGNTAAAFDSSSVYYGPPVMIVENACFKTFLFAVFSHSQR